MASWNTDYDASFVARLIAEARLPRSTGTPSFRGVEYQRIATLLPSMVVLDGTIPNSERYGLLTQAVSRAAEHATITPQYLLEHISRMESKFWQDPGQGTWSSQIFLSHEALGLAP